MTQFHDPTLALLGDEGVRSERSVETLLNYAEANDIVLPAAYLEWAKLDDGSLLGKYSNCDSFYFDEPELVVTPEGVRGLIFHTENQGNFDIIVALDQGDDPPVLYAWNGQPPWILHCQRFSECVFARIFDRQYLFDFNDPDSPDQGEIAYSGSMSLRSSHCLKYLRQRFQETVTTHYLIYDNQFTEYRFWGDLLTHLSVRVDEDMTAHIHITGERKSVLILEEQLQKSFGEDVLPEVFYDILGATNFLGYVLDQDQFWRFQHSFILAPDSDALSRLLVCHQALSLDERAQNLPFSYLSFPEESSSFVLGGTDWGVTIYFQRVEADSYQGWSIERIE
jgi:hypothetical protein